MKLDINVNVTITDRVVQSIVWITALVSHLNNINYTASEAIRNANSCLAMYRSNCDV
ncbi:unnamed protein product [marine sediment metagenome]|uniref:Uncharacterized protein n=1 Tax=marine sediment metagenome TaxID=412755 RepID=X1B065_9ZZZZ